MPTFLSPRRANLDKLRRRDALKAFAGAGAFMAAVPYLPRIPLLGKDSAGQLGAAGAEPALAEKEPLVVVVTGNELVAFEGLREFTIKDATFVRDLAGKLRGRMVE